MLARRWERERYLRHERCRIAGPAVRPASIAISRIKSPTLAGEVAFSFFSPSLPPPCTANYSLLRYHRRLTRRGVKGWGGLIVRFAMPRLTRYDGPFLLYFVGVEGTRRRSAL